jgi:Flp pilus assembly protein TadD
MTAPGEAVTKRAGELPVVLIALITVMVFLPALQNGFVQWDDETLVNNSNYRGLGPAELRWMFGQFHFGRYQPLSWMSLGFDHLIWWADPFGYHWSSLLLHATNAIAFYFIATRLLSLCDSVRAALTEPVLRTAAGVAALIFAIHPQRVESVAWASARGEILAASFFLGSLLCYLRAADFAEEKHRSVWWMAASLSAYGLSLLSGVNGMALPIILLVLDVYPLGRLASSRSWLAPEARRLYWQKAPYFLLAFLALIIASAAASHNQASSTTSQWAIRALADLIAAPAFYLWKAVVPLRLSPSYELPVWSLILAILASVGISVGLFVTRKRWPVLLTSWICCLVLLVPLPGSHVDGQQILADRHTYLSHLPWALLLGAAVLYTWHTAMRSRATSWTAFVGTGVSALVFILVGVLTWTQTRVWHDSESLWRHAVAATESSQAHYNLAALFEAQGKYDDAIRSYRQVTEIRPEHWDAHEKAALLLQKQGKIREAVGHLRRVVEINPAATEAHSNLAAGLVHQGQVADAARHFRRVLELAPERNEIRVKLATLLAIHGSLADATALLHEAVTKEPGDAKTLLKFGQVLAAQGSLDRATQHLREAVRIEPEDAEIHESLGRALAEQGKRDEAAKHMREAIRILKSTPISQ